VYTGIAASASVVMHAETAGQPAKKLRSSQAWPKLTAGKHVPQVVGPMGPAGLMNAVPWQAALWH
jgi:hypothetical protein